MYVWDEWVVVCYIKVGFPLMSEKQEVIATKHYFFSTKLIVIIFEGL